jgi:hypothetical protein
MATTTNYGWTTPDNTAYVKDGASAIRTLGSSVDTTLNSVTSGKNVGMVHLNTTTFTGASTVAVDNVFTSSFENYFVEVNLSSTGNGDVLVNLRTSAPATDTNLHQYSAFYQASNGTGVTSFFGNTTTAWVAGYAEANVQSAQIKWDFLSPQVSTRRTGFFASAVRYTAANTQANTQVSGIHSQLSAYTGFIVSGPTGLTGNIRVYGLRN